MPGLFGIFGETRLDHKNVLHSEFTRIFSEVLFLKLDEDKICLGGHAHNPSVSIGHKDSYYFMVNGEASIYKYLEKEKPKSVEGLFTVKNGNLAVSDKCRGNILLYDDREATVHFFKDWTSCFPFYFTIYNDKLFVSSHLVPLAKAINAERDPVGMVEYLLWGYCIGQRTPFSNISKLCPGQSVSYNISLKKITIKETSQLWTENDSRPSFENITDELCEYLKSYSNEHFSTQGEEKIGIMLSAGWDSRLVLASMLATNPRNSLFAITYEASKQQSREASIVENIAKSLNVRLRKEKFIIDAFDIDFLYDVFVKSEDCCFSQWHRCGKVFQNAGIKHLTSGLLGEVLGGHYGLGMIGNSTQKAFHFLASYFGLETKEATSVASATAMLTQFHSKLPWFLKDSFHSEYPNIREEIIQDVESEAKRYQYRGVSDGDRLIEAFVSEHRGLGHITGQGLAARSFVDIALPFADRQIISKVTSIPFSYKVHNKLTRAIIKKLSPELLSFPTAAILISSKYPILFQEASRFLRSTIDSFYWKRYVHSKGGSRPTSQVSYDNCEYLRDGKAYKELINHLSLDYIDKNKYLKFINDVAEFRHPVPCFMINWQILKMLTLDFMSRKR